MTPEQVAEEIWGRLTEGQRAHLNAQTSREAIMRAWGERPLPCSFDAVLDVLFDLAYERVQRNRRRVR